MRSLRTYSARTSILLVLIAVPLLITSCGMVAQTSSTSSASDSPFLVLGEAELTSVAPASYADTAAAQRSIATTAVQQKVHVFSGAVARDIVLGGRTVGGVQLYRFASDVAPTDRERFVPMVVFEFAGTSPAPGKVGGKVVQKAASATDAGAVVVGWQQGDDLLVLWAVDDATAQDLASRYIMRSV